MTIPGTDGRKMSKTYNNTIDVFLEEKDLKKQIMSIITDSKGLEESKNAEQCNVYKIYNLIAKKNQSDEMKNKYLSGGYGYGHAKNELLEFRRNRTGCYCQPLAFKKARSKTESSLANQSCSASA